jgi:curved DNA-binding protein
VMIDIDDTFNGATRTVTLQAPELGAMGRMVTRERTLNVQIPKGIRQGQRIRLAGQGSPGLEGSDAGDLYLEVVFQPHSLYRTEGRDLYLELPLAPWEAALGATVKIPTPLGTVDLKIPAGSSTGKKMRLVGRGIPAKTAGDLYAVLRIALPPGDSPEAHALYRKMEEELSFNPRASLGV